MNVKLAMMILVACCLGLLSWMSPVMGQGSCGWTTVGNALNGYVRALAVFDGGTGPALYAGGDFTMAGTTVVNGIARWSEW